jgi:hypothetical protein
VTTTSGLTTPSASRTALDAEASSLTARPIDDTMAPPAGLTTRVTEAEGLAGPLGGLNCPRCRC